MFAAAGADAWNDGTFHYLKSLTFAAKSEAYKRSGKDTAAAETRSMQVARGGGVPGGVSNLRPILHPVQYPVLYPAHAARAQVGAAVDAAALGGMRSASRLATCGGATHPPEQLRPMSRADEIQGADP
jgi:hypothetical protein